MASKPQRQFYAISDGSDCDHQRVHHLAGGGDVNRYYRCPDCDGVLVRQGGPTPTGGADDLGTIDPEMGDLMAELEAHDGVRSPNSSETNSVLGRFAAAWRRLVH